VLVSATMGVGLADLLRAIESRFANLDEELDLEIPADGGELLAWLHANASVLAQSTDEDGTIRLRVRIDRAKQGRLQARLAKLRRT